MLTDVSTALAAVIFRVRAAKVIETSINKNTNSSSQDFTNMDHLHLQAHKNEVNNTAYT